MEEPIEAGTPARKQIGHRLACCSREGDTIVVTSLAPSADLIALLQLGAEVAVGEPATVGTLSRPPRSSPEAPSP